LSLTEISEFFDAYGLLIVFVLAFAFIIWYLIGSWINLKIMRRYARILEEHLKPRGISVKYRKISGGRGFRALCLIGDDRRFERVEVAINLADRDNAMHYPLVPIMRDRDRMICWAFLREKPYCAVEIASKSAAKAIQREFRRSPEKYGDFKMFFIDSEFDREYKVFAKTERYLHAVFPVKIRKDLLDMRRHIRNLSVNEDQSFLRLSATAKDETIPRVLDFIWDLGNTAAPRSTKT